MFYLKQIAFLGCLKKVTTNTQLFIGTHPFFCWVACFHFSLCQIKMLGYTVMSFQDCYIAIYRFCSLLQTLYQLQEVEFTFSYCCKKNVQTRIVEYDSNSPEPSWNSKIRFTLTCDEDKSSSVDGITLKDCFSCPEIKQHSLKKKFFNKYQQSYWIQAPTWLDWRRYVCN